MVGWQQIFESPAQQEGSILIIDFLTFINQKCRMLTIFMLCSSNIYFCWQDYGHRVRLATHANFKDFVMTTGLEFYPLGGDPKVLAGCM